MTWQEDAATARAGIARERQQAQAAAVGAGMTSWYVKDGIFVVTYNLRVVAYFDLDEWGAEAAMAMAEYIAAHDPARVLDDCDRAEEDLAAWLRVAAWEPGTLPAMLATQALARLAATYGGEG